MFTAREVKCVSPMVGIRHVSGRVADTPLQVRLPAAGGVSIGSDWLRLRRFNNSQLFVSALQPAGGPAAGGSLITVHGQFFHPPLRTLESDLLTCHFAPLDEQSDAPPDPLAATPATAPATALDSRAARCRSPARLAPAQLLLSLSYGGSLFQSDALFTLYVVGGAPLPLYPTRSANASASSQSAFRSNATNQTVVTMLSLVSVLPVGGPSLGGTLVRLQAAGLSQQMGGTDRHGREVLGYYCRFAPPAEMASSREVAAGVHTQQHMAIQAHPTSPKPIPPHTTPSILTPSHHNSPHPIPTHPAQTLPPPHPPLTPHPTSLHSYVTPFY